MIYYLVDMLTWHILLPLLLQPVCSGSDHHEASFLAGSAGGMVLPSEALKVISFIVGIRLIHGLCSSHVWPHKNFLQLGLTWNFSKSFSLLDIDDVKSSNHTKVVQRYLEFWTNLCNNLHCHIWVFATPHCKIVYLSKEKYLCLVDLYLV